MVFRHAGIAIAILVVAFGSTDQSGTASGQAAKAGQVGSSQESWPFIWGPHFDGHSTEKDLADSWPAEGPPVLWTNPLGQGYSSFVGWDNRVATQAQTLGDQHVICLDADTGETIWQYRYDWPYDPAGVYPGPRATPTYADGRLYFAAPDGLIGCLDSDKGRLIWSINLVEQFSGKGTEFGYSCSPTVVDGKVVLPVGGADASMVALDAQDGSIIWKSGSDPARYTPAYPITFRGRRLVIGYLQNAMVCHDLGTGERIWRKDLSYGYDEHSAWPIYTEPYVWISSPFRTGAELFELTGDSTQPLRSVWHSRQMSNDIFSSVLVDGAIYGFDLLDPQAKVHRPTRGQFRCLDIGTGKVLWSVGNTKTRRSSFDMDEEDIGKRIGHATVLVAGGKLILMNDTGELILARANRERYEELARVQVLGGELCWTQPMLYRGRLYVRNQTRAACIYLGRLPLNENSSIDAITVADIPQSNYVDVAAAILSIEPEYAFDLPTDEWLRDWFLISLVGVMGASAAVAIVVNLLSRRIRFR